MTFDPYQTFPKFYDNKFIKQIADNPKWTISDNNKRPISIPDLTSVLLNGSPSTSTIHGANQYDAEDTTTLSNLLKLLPTASNHAYKLNAKTDGFVVLDIEKTCPNDLKEKFLKIPYLYGEHSLSGTGIHLICPLPQNWNKFPEVHDTTKIQEPKGRYEILLNHWVTFTRNTLVLPSSVGDGEHDISSVFKYLCTNINTNQSVKIKPTLNKPNIPSEGRIALMLNDFKYDKKLSDFPMAGREGDESKYEFGVTSSVAYRIIDITERYPSFNKYDYTNEQLAWLVYNKINSYLPYRDKYDTYRDKMPYLLYLALKAVTLIKSRKD